MTTPLTIGEGTALVDIIRLAGGRLDTPEALYADYRTARAEDRAEGRSRGLCPGDDGSGDDLTFERFVELMDSCTPKATVAGQVYYLTVQTREATEGFVKRCDAVIRANARKNAEDNGLMGLVGLTARANPQLALRAAQATIHGERTEGSPIKAIEFEEFTRLAFERIDGYKLPADAFSETVCREAFEESRAAQEAQAAEDAVPVN